ncbi:MAG TPA: hypothetical protein PKX56_01970 [Marmoricola sp.]|nr:hypothetical protein [Marmoricola sp.]HNI70911.1 hypothetical protein [Marmoricola sp.]HNJ78094.1 hypothetical protein [Marmoricola sp.]HNO39287.1 hypothetical protein [Marmoricola sp.]
MRASKKNKCQTGKIRFRDHNEAVGFLHSAANARKVANELGLATTRREVRSYRCNLCRGFHVTSKDQVLAA